MDLYATVDIPEGETFGSSYFPIPGIRRDSADIRNVDPDPIMLKFASSAAHLTGKNLASTETFTWLGEHFKSAFSQAKPELEQAFLAGINHMFYHGVTYSPVGVGFPGWLFYASLNLNTHNSLWPHFKGFNNYIQRAQSVFQAGNPDNELLVYRPVYDVWADPEGLSKMLTVHGIDEWLHPTPFYKESKSLMKRGYSIDFISDALLAELDVEGEALISGGGKNKSKVLIIPESQFMPLTTLEQILVLVEMGAQVVFQSKPKQVPGFLDVESRKAAFDKLWEEIGIVSTTDSISQVGHGKGRILLATDLEEALALLEIRRETLVDEGLKFIRRDLNGEKLYFIVNHTAERMDKSLQVNARYQAAVLMNPQQGNRGLAALEFEGEMPLVRIGLDPGEAMVLHLVESQPLDLDQKGVEWRNYHEINFVNIDYGPFDASGWEIMPSGLAGPVSIKIYH